MEKVGEAVGEILSNYDVLGAFVETLKYAILGGLGALVIGTIIAIMRVSPVGVLQRFGAFYVNTVRNTPLTLLVVLSILGMSYIVGLQFSDDVSANTFRWGVVMLALYHATFVAEALRSGVNTIPLGQAEAARSIGLTFGQSMREVLLPQAFRGAIAPLGSTLVALIKNTTIVAAIGGKEAAKLLSTIIENEGSSFTAFLIIALGFVILTLPLGIYFTHLSERLAVKR